MLDQPGGNGPGSSESRIPTHIEYESTALCECGESTIKFHLVTDTPEANISDVSVNEAVSVGMLLLPQHLCCGRCTTCSNRNLLAAPEQCKFYLAVFFSPHWPK